MNGGPSPIARVRHLRLTDFRGFKGTHHLDTDADLVLITGSNGTGKTSLLEALTLLLTGWHSHDAADLASRDQEGTPAKGFELEATVTGGTGRLRLHHSGGEKPGLPEGLPSSRLTQPGAGKTSDYELQARLCAFFQDRLDSLFDQAARGHTLRDVFEPLHKKVQHIEQALPAAIARLKEEAKTRLGDTWTGKPPEDLQKDLQAAVATVSALLNEMDGHKEDGQFPVALEADGADLAAFDRAATDWLASRGRQLGSRAWSDLRDTFEDEVKRTLAAWIDRAARQAKEESENTRNLQAELDAVQAKLAKIAGDFPHLDADLAHYAAPDGLPDALALFQALANHAGAWAKPPPGDDAGALARIGEEFARVSTTDAGKCVEILGAWLAPRRAAGKERAGLMEEQNRLKKELKNSLTSERLKNLQDIQQRMTPALKTLADAWKESHQHRTWEVNAENRKRARERLEEEVAVAEAVQEKLQFLTAPGKELMEDLRKRADTVLGRFALVEGVLPLKLETRETQIQNTTRRLYHVATNDNRRLEHLSTGQRAQVAVSLLVAQNLAVSTMLAHRVILLDDVTTAYDLSNLTREAILWRQLAYGTDDEQMRRQVFISSHHEDMSNHLLDLLVPPPDEEQGKERRTMRLIRFTGWSNQTGPTYESYTVEPSRAVDRNDLAEALGKL